jgi:hypothetical protein
MIYKQVSETINSGIDFSPGLSVGETISTVAAVVVSPIGGITVNQTTIASDGLSVIINIAAGVTGSAYNIVVIVTTSYGQTLVCNEKVVIISPIITPNWENVMVIMLRSMIGDNLVPYTYSDRSLKSIIVVSTVMTLKEVDFIYPYVVDVYNTTISPDPVLYKDNSFLGLVSLCAASMIADGEYRNASRYAVSHRDGPSHIDTKGIAENLKNVAKNVAAAYNNALQDYKLGNGSPGVSIIGPYNYNDNYLGYGNNINLNNRRG